MNTNEKGRSMVEMFGVLAIVAVLTVTGIVGYTQAMYRHKMNVIKQQITEIAMNIKNAYLHIGKYDGINNETAIRLRLVPEEMIDRSDPENPYKIVNLFKGEITIMATNSETGLSCDGTVNDPCDSFVVNVTHLPPRPIFELQLFPWVDLDMVNMEIHDSDKAEQTAGGAGGAEGSENNVENTDDSENNTEENNE